MTAAVLAGPSLTAAPLAAAANAGTGVSPLWYAARATGVVALVLLTVTVVMGIAAHAGLAAPGLPRMVTGGLHRNVSLLVLAFVAAHVLTTVLDSYTPIGLVAAFVPFSSSYRPLWLSLGAVSLDLLLALTLTSLVRDRMSYRAWRAVHGLAYACWPVALWHGLGTGTDSRLPWLLLIDAACLASVTGAACWRLSRLAPGTARSAGIAAAVLLPLGTAVFVLAGPLQPGWARRAGTPAVLLGAVTTRPVRRLTAGWHQAVRPASLGEHRDRYGPLPRVGPALTDAVAEAGLTGRGGGGFPTGVKMRAVAARRGGAVVVANGMESEPASEKDQALLARSPHLVLDGAVLAARAVGAGTVHLCLDRMRTQQISDLERAVAERRGQGWDPVRLLVHGLPRHYVSSEETSLVRWLNGGEAKPSATPPRPSDRGVGRRPTLVDNVETLAHVALIGRFGPGWFRSAGSADAPGTSLVTAAGAVAGPGVYEIEGGTLTGDVLAMSGAADGGAVLLGGYGGSWHPVGQVAGLPLTAAGLRPAGAAPGAGLVLVLPPGGCGVAETARILGFLAAQGAQQCGPCRFGLPAIADDFTQLAAGRPEGRVLDRLDRRLGAIRGRGACRHPDGAVRLAASALAAFAADVRAHAAGQPCPASGRGRGTAPFPRPGADGGWR
jgi:NADH:ubiquinone oxidoreductase subunit F (NADH-binding)